MRKRISSRKASTESDSDDEPMDVNENEKSLVEQDSDTIGMF